MRNRLVRALVPSFAPQRRTEGLWPVPDDSGRLWALRFRSKHSSEDETNDDLAASNPLSRFQNMICRLESMGRKIISIEGSDLMRIVILTAALFSMCLGAPRVDVPGADTNPYITLTHEIKDGTLRISAKNVSQKPILAYVIAVEDGGQVTTHHDYYTGRGSF